LVPLISANSLSKAIVLSVFLKRNFSTCQMEIFLDTISGSKTNKKESHLWHLKGKVDIPSFVQSQNGFWNGQKSKFPDFSNF